MNAWRSIDPPPPPTILRMGASRERQIPLILIGVGLVLSAIGAMRRLGPAGTPLALAVLIGAAVLGTGLMLVAAFVTASLINASFGELKSAILKLAAIYLFPSSLFAVFPLWVGFVLSGTLSFCLLLWLFDLEMREARIFTAVELVVELLVILAIAGLIL